MKQTINKYLEKLNHELPLDVSGKHTAENKLFFHVTGKDGRRSARKLHLFPTEECIVLVVTHSQHTWVLHENRSSANDGN